MIAAHFPILTILTFFFAALAMPLVGLIHRRMPWAVAVLASCLATGLSFFALVRVLQDGPVRYDVGGWPPPIGIELVADPLSTFLAFVLALVASVVLVHSREPVETELAGREMAFYAQAMLLLGGFAGMVATGDLFNLYVFLEINSLAGYALLGSAGPRSAAVTFRYLLLGTIGASFYLLGLGFLFAQTGSLNMQDVQSILAVTGLDPITTLALVFILVGIGIKMALVPLHQWLPDVYTSAPASSTALIAPLGTKVAAYVVIRLLYDVFPAEPLLAHVRALDLLGLLGAAGVLWGSIMAIPQHNLKRMLAYSSVAQIGYIALGIGLGTAFGFIGAILHVLNHACMKACLFLVSANLETHGKSLDIPSFDGTLRRDLPLTSASFTLAALSMIGLPPTAGFFSKWYLLLGSYEESRWLFVAVILSSSLLNAVYFFRVIERMYMGGANHARQRVARPGSTWLTAPVVALASSLIVLGLANVLIVRHLIRPMLPPAL
jgi:multicomponent Na+:H+ antiporter subunit D